MKYSDMMLGTIEAVVNKLGGEDGVRRFLAGELTVSTSPTAIVAGNPDLLTIDYSQTLEQMIAAGHYDWVNSDINPTRFPISGTGVVEVEYKEFYFDCCLELDEAKACIEKDGWEVGKIEHLLAFGTKFPEKQRQYSIIALGSVCEVLIGVSVASLDGDARRSVNFHGWDVRWSHVCRFLAVRKKVSDPRT